MARSTMLSYHVTLLLLAFVATTSAQDACNHNGQSHNNLDIIQHPNGCGELQCQFGEIVPIYEACGSELDNQCHALDEYIVYKGKRYLCSKSNASDTSTSYEYINKELTTAESQIIYNCRIGNQLIINGDMFVTKDTCRIRQCQNGASPFLKYACTASDKKCHFVGEMWIANGGTVTCTFNNYVFKIIPAKISLRSTTTPRVTADTTSPRSFRQNGFRTHKASHATPAQSTATTTLPRATTKLPEATTTLPRVATTLPQAATKLPEATTTLPQATIRPPAARPKSRAVKPCYQLANTYIVFVLDTSGSVPIDSLYGSVQLIKILGGLLKGTYFGFITFGSSTTTVSELTKDTVELYRRLNNAKFHNSTTNTGIAVDLGSSLLSRAPNNANRFLVILTDGESTNSTSTIISVQKAHQSHIVTLAVGIGLNPNQKELKNLASDESKVFVVRNSDDIAKLARFVKGLVCTAEDSNT